jgi:hypothetical protein
MMATASAQPTSLLRLSAAKPRLAAGLRFNSAEATNKLVNLGISAHIDRLGGRCATFAGGSV